MNINWVVDVNDIFRNEKNAEISYPDVGNDSCFAFEDISPWFKQRNELINTLIYRNNLNGNFLDIGGGNGFQAKSLEENNSIEKIYLVEPDIYKSDLKIKIQSKAA